MQRSERYALTAIVILSLFLTLYRLNKSAMVAVDEGLYFNFVKTMRVPVDFTISRFNNKLANLSFVQYLQQKGGIIYMAGKPTYLGVAFLASLLIGLKDYTLPIVSALAGVLILILVFFISRRLKDTGLGVISVLLLAVSWFHLTYSRSAFPHVTGTFFAYLAFLLYLMAQDSGNTNRKKNMIIFLYGVSIGLAVTTHYYFYWLIFLFGMLELINFVRGAINKESPFGRFLIWSFGLLLPILFWQAVTFIIKSWIDLHPDYLRLSKGMSGEGGFVSYFEQLYSQVSASNRQTGYQGNLWFYPRIIFLKEGLPFLLAFVTGLDIMLWRTIRKPGANVNILILTSYFLITYVSLGLYSHFPTTRTFYIAIPAMCIIAAYPLSIIFSKRNLLPGIFLTTAVLAVQLSSSLPILRSSSGFKDAIDFMHNNKGVKHLSSNYLISRVYVDRDQAFDMSFSYRDKDIDPSGKTHIDIKKLKDFAVANDVHYLLLDQYRFNYPNEILRASTKLKPLFSEKHSTFNFLYDNKESQQKSILESDQTIDIYDLNEVVRTIERG
ncbi:MAG: glycosyltransferase family 39 protein [Candidatus Omnitrophota bacterium]